MPTVVIDSSALVDFVNGSRLPFGSDAPDRRVYEYVMWRRDSQKDRVYLPTPVLAEFLCSPQASDGNGIEDFVVQLAKTFPIPPFDVKAAKVLGRMFMTMGGKKEVKKQLGELYDWQMIKVDMQIVAVAISIGANDFISFDKRQCNLATAQGLRVLKRTDCIAPVMKPINGPDLFANHSDE